jgi:hypothetical protein
LLQASQRLVHCCIFDVCSGFQRSFYFFQILIHTSLQALAVPTHFLLSLFVFNFSFSGYTFHPALNLWILRPCFYRRSEPSFLDLLRTWFPATNQLSKRQRSLRPLVASRALFTSSVSSYPSLFILTKRKFVSQEFGLSSPLPRQSIHRPEL